MTAQDILKLIETVSPDDTDTLDEIDARVWCLLNNHIFQGIYRNDDGREYLACADVEMLLGTPYEEYTRSRDELKRIRPDGWKISSLYQSSIHGWILNLIPLDGEACLNFIKNSIKPPVTGDDFRPVSYYATIPVFDSLMHGMTIDPETLAWWQTQDREACNEFTIYFASKKLERAMVEFTNWFKSTGAERVYCQGAAFDIPIIEAAFKRVGLKAPWDFWNVRDTRTVYDTLGFDPKSIERQGTYHNALDDARHQIKCVQAAFKTREV